MTSLKTIPLAWHCARNRRMDLATSATLASEREPRRAASRTEPPAHSSCFRFFFFFQGRVKGGKQVRVFSFRPGKVSLSLSPSFCLSLSFSPPPSLSYRDQVQARVVLERLEERHGVERGPQLPHHVGLRPQLEQVPRRRRAPPGDLGDRLDRGGGPLAVPAAAGPHDAEGAGAEDLAHLVGLRKVPAVAKDVGDLLGGQLGLRRELEHGAVRRRGEIVGRRGPRGGGDGRGRRGRGRGDERGAGGLLVLLLLLLLLLLLVLPHSLKEARRDDRGRPSEVRSVHSCRRRGGAAPERREGIGPVFFFFFGGGGLGREEVLMVLSFLLRSRFGAPSGKK